VPRALHQERALSNNDSPCPHCGNGAETRTGPNTRSKTRHCQAGLTVALAFNCHRHDEATQRDEMYFSRRICFTGRPNSCSAAKAASTMFGLPHR
jgi:hypothetical protein